MAAAAAAASSQAPSAVRNSSLQESAVAAEAVAAGRQAASTVFRTSSFPASAVAAAAQQPQPRFLFLVFMIVRVLCRTAPLSYLLCSKIAHATHMRKRACLGIVSASILLSMRWVSQSSISRCAASSSSWKLMWPLSRCAHSLLAFFLCATSSSRCAFRFRSASVLPEHP